LTEFSGKKEKTFFMYSKLYLKSGFGIFEITGSESGIKSVKKVEANDFEDIKPPKPVRDGAIQLEEYFKGKRKEFDLKFDWSGSPEFHQRVWSELVKIPFGRTCSYLDIAEKLGDKKSVRAVGQANRNNPIAIIVPCHRVIAKNGDLHGYFYGLDMKQKLLEHENPLQFGRQTSLF
jgi:methylated-DNA-[protein]-cysteine S-methyltransferase